MVDARAAAHALTSRSIVLIVDSVEVGLESSVLGRHDAESMRMAAGVTAARWRVIADRRRWRVRPIPPRPGLVAMPAVPAISAMPAMPEEVQQRIGEQEQEGRHLQQMGTVARDQPCHRGAGPARAATGSGETSPDPGAESWGNPVMRPALFVIHWLLQKSSASHRVSRLSNHAKKDPKAQRPGAQSTSSAVQGTPATQTAAGRPCR